jgi:hypothetical protein
MQLEKLDPKRTALLTLDCQRDIFGLFPVAEAIVPTPPKVLAHGHGADHNGKNSVLGFSLDWGENDNRFDSL